jgi:hypothetical protein
MARSRRQRLVFYTSNQCTNCGAVFLTNRTSGCRELFSRPKESCIRPKETSMSNIVIHDLSPVAHASAEGKQKEVLDLALK